MEELNAGALIAACSDEAADAGITIRSVLEPLSGAGAPVKPASYEGGRFQEDRRWWGSGNDRRPVEVLVIDNEPSQANRLEAALEQRRADLGLPEIVLDLASVGALPPHLPGQISSFRFPHRNADAYLRDSLLNGGRFLNADAGAAIFGATADRPEALLQWFPQALLLGFWQSHLGKKRSQAKLARAWISEIIGVEPATTKMSHEATKGDQLNPGTRARADSRLTRTRREATKGDPLNLSVDERIDWNENDHGDWAVAEAGENLTRPKPQKAKLRLSEVGHGQIITRPEDQAPAAVSFREIIQQSTVSFAALRRIRAKTGSAEARALLVSLGVVAHVAAFGRSFSLRSGAELRPATTNWTWLSEKENREIEPPGLDTAIRVFKECTGRAEQAGLPVGRQWAASPLVLTPGANLAAAIRKTWPGN